MTASRAIWRCSAKLASRMSASRLRSPHALALTLITWHRAHNGEAVRPLCCVGLSGEGAGSGGAVHTRCILSGPEDLSAPWCQECARNAPGCSIPGASCQDHAQRFKTCKVLLTTCKCRLYTAAIIITIVTVWLLTSLLFIKCCHLSQLMGHQERDGSSSFCSAMTANKVSILCMNWGHILAVFSFIWQAQPAAATIETARL